MSDPLRGFVRRNVSPGARRKVWHFLHRHRVTRPLARVDLDPVAEAPVPAGRPSGPAARRKATVPPVVELTGGHQLAGDGGALPVVLVLAVGMADEQLAAWATEMARAQTLTARFRPLWLTDSAAIGRLRSYGWAVDTVVSRAAWRRLEQPTSYDAYVLGRVAELRRRFRASVLPLTDGAPTEGDARTRLWWALSSL